MPPLRLALHIPRRMQQFDIREEDVLETVNPPTLVQVIGNEKITTPRLHLFVKRFVRRAPYFLVVFAYRFSVQMFVDGVMKVYESLDSEIERRSPLEIIHLMADKFGFESTLGKVTKRFFSQESILLPGPAPPGPRIPISYHNPNNHSTFALIFAEVEHGPLTFTHCQLCCVLDRDRYIDWLHAQEEESGRFESEVVRIREYAENRVLPDSRGKPFGEKIFGIVHDFCFYCRQHPAAIRSLKEEHIRDIFLVIVKAVFSTGEGEAFHYDGKLDFKIINPDNKYEFCTGEFKWWHGPESANEVFHQAVRKHANGQELAIFAIILSSAKSGRSIFEKSISVFDSEREITNAEAKMQIPA